MNNCPDDGARVIDCPKPGKIIFGHYRFIDLVAAGGMGVVYRCLNTYLDKEVAVKTLVSQKFGPDQVVRFQREARAAGSLNHANIVSVHDFGITDDGNPYMVMDFFQGRTLNNYIKNQHQFSIDEIIDFASQTCEGMAFAHSRGILHRDLKPANLMLAEVGGILVVKILDFGIAKMLNEESLTSMNLTRTGEIFGTPYYMSPEQSHGGEVDRRSDIYSLGCVLYEMLTGTPPFVGDHALHTITMHKDEAYVTIRERKPDCAIPEALETLIDKMLSKNPDERPVSALAVRDELVKIQHIEDSKKNGHSSDDRKSVEKKSMLVPQVVLVLASSAMLIGCCFYFFNQIVANESPSDKTVSKPVAVPVKEDSGYEISEVDDIGFGLLKEAVKKQSTSVEMGVDSRKLTDEHFELLAQDRRVNFLSIPEGTGLTARRLLLIKSLPIKTMRISLSDIDDAGLEVISQMPLEDLDIEGCGKVTDKGFAAICNRNRVQLLSIGDTSLGTVSYKNLQKLRNLSMLRIRTIGPDERGRHRSLTDADLKMLCSINSLVSIDIKNQQLVSDEGIIALCSLPNLRILDSGGTKITSKCFPAIAKSHLQKVFLRYCPNLSREDVKNLERMAHQAGKKNFDVNPD